MQRKYKLALTSALLGKIVWLGLSPRIARLLYARVLFRYENGKGQRSSLLEYNEVENTELTFPNRKGKQLHAWFFRHPTSEKVLMYCPGRSADIAARLEHIKRLLSTGASVFIFEYSGFGLSEGRPTIGGICNDGVDAYDFLTKELHYDGHNVVLLGESLGSGVATHISTHREVGGIILQSPYVSIERIGKQHIPLLRTYPSFLFPAVRLDNLAVLKKPHAPLLIIHGERDTTISIKHSEELFAEALEPKRFVRGPRSTHKELHPQDVPLFVASIADFLNSL